MGAWDFFSPQARHAKAISQDTQAPLHVRTVDDEPSVASLLRLAVSLLPVQYLHARS